MVNLSLAIRYRTKFRLGPNLMVLVKGFPTYTYSSSFGVRSFIRCHLLDGDMKITGVKESPGGEVEAHCRSSPLTLTLALINCSKSDIWIHVRKSLWLHDVQLHFICSQRLWNKLSFSDYDFCQVHVFFKIYESYFWIYERFSFDSWLWFLTWTLSNNICL